MPTAPLRYCATPGCSNRVARGHCVEHRTHRREQVTRYGDAVLYNTAAWKRLRLWWLGTHPYCATCGHLANEVDHIVPHRGDRARFWDTTNWQSLCKSCHSLKTHDEVLDSAPR